ncbi:MAG: FAD-dependent oxidoreductase [Eubacteriaceae bacterium]|nr:FAD-dependent oxidoreductase [Eubacteriaceae bacterium]
MKTITEPSREIPVRGEADVIVVGGGLAGVSAALAAARCGKKVILIEKSIVLGGLATLGHVCIYLPIDDGMGNRVFGGQVQELLHVCARYGYDSIPDCWKGGAEKVEGTHERYKTNFNIPAAVYALDEITSDEKVEVIYDTSFCAPIMEGNTCKGIIVENKSGRGAYLADMFIDSTGDADLFARAGAQCEIRKNRLSFWTHEIDTASMKKALETGRVYDAVPLRWFGYIPGKSGSADTVPEFYGTDADEVNTYIKMSRKLALDYLKEHQAEDFTQMTIPFMPQFRMTRHIVGKTVFAVEPGVSVDSSVGCVIPCTDQPAAVYEFPYEGLIDSDITNILAAGRMVSATGKGWEIMRNIPSCVLTGQAAGTAASLAISAKKTVQDLNVAALQEKLAAGGVKIHMADELRNNQNLPPVPKPQGSIYNVRS